MKIRAGALTLVIASVALIACTPELDWRELSVPEGRFAVLLPGKAQRDARVLDTPAGAVTMTIVGLHYWPTPNGWKVSIMLEYCGLPCTLKPVNIGRGEQFSPEFLAISPNNRMPATIDHEPSGGGAPVAVLENPSAWYGNTIPMGQGYDRG